MQIGDPVTEKLLIDVLVGAEDLYTAITDCGAGGLSSAVGEMADGVGADVELDLVPLKYAGLEPWEIWLSEAQERMVVAVDPHRLGELRERCRAHGVELADLGSFTGDRRLVVRSHGDVVLDLDTGFLHDGRPPRRMTATMPMPDRTTGIGRTVDDPRSVAARAARPPQHRVQGHHDPPLRPRDPGRHGGPPARRCAVRCAGRRCRPRRSRRRRRPGDRHRRQPVVRAPRPVGDGVRRRRRGDPQHRRRRCRPRPRVVARQLLVGRPTAGVDARRPGRRRRRMLRGGHRPRRAVRVGEGLAQQRVHRRRRRAPRRAPDAGDHRRRPRPRRRRLRHPRSGCGRRRAVPARRHARRVRREPPRPRARCAGQGGLGAPRPTRSLRRATATSTGRSAPASCGRATT